jgi:hypothetical protein
LHSVSFYLFALTNVKNTRVIAPLFLCAFF